MTGPPPRDPIDALAIRIDVSRSSRADFDPSIFTRVFRKKFSQPSARPRVMIGHSRARDAPKPPCLTSDLWPPIVASNPRPNCQRTPTADASILLSPHLVVGHKIGRAAQIFAPPIRTVHHARPRPRRHRHGIADKPVPPRSALPPAARRHAISKNAAAPPPPFPLVAARPNSMLDSHTRTPAPTLQRPTRPPPPAAPPQPDQPATGRRL